MLAHRAVDWVWLDDAIRAITESAKPEGTCNFLAGEHLSHVNGWQDSAVLSAHRVVSEICQRVRSAQA
jgi:monoamine oxidase